MPYPLVGSLLNPITFWVRAALANLPLAGLRVMAPGSNGLTSLCFPKLRSLTLLTHPGYRRALSSPLSLYTLLYPLPSTLYPLPSL